MLIIPGVEADEARLAAICDKYGIAELKVFGSRARGQAAPDSDIDILYALRQRRDALLWNFTVPGEAAGQVSEEVKERFPDIAWQQPQRLRNRIVHGYWPNDLTVLHTTATDQLPRFASSLRRALITLNQGT